MIWNGPQLMGTENMQCVESYTVPYVLSTILRWHTLPVCWETMPCTRVSVQGGLWIGSIFNSDLCDLAYLHWFLQGYLMMFKIPTHAEVLACPTWERQYSMWCVHHIHRSCSCLLCWREFLDPWQLYIVAYINNKLFSKWCWLNVHCVEIYYSNCKLVFPMCFAWNPYSLVLIWRIPAYLGIKGDHFFQTYGFFLAVILRTNYFLWRQGKITEVSWFPT